MDSEFRELKLKKISGLEIYKPNLFSVLYDWERLETEREYFTCRPVKDLPESQVYFEQLQEWILSDEIELYVLVAELNQPVGKLVMFDLNPRNRSAEFGYYLPPEYRGKGLGTQMVSLFLRDVFADDSRLNKLYATTAACNTRSVRLLEGLNFTLDGRLREHYWINGSRYDQLIYSKLRAEWEENRTFKV